jgi:hypothetical protein
LYLKKQPPRSKNLGGNNLDLRVCSGFHGNREHAFQQFFKGHRVDAQSVTVDKVTVAIPFPVCIGDAMRIIGAVNCDCKGFKVESFTFLGVAFGFFDLADHSRVHFLISFRE